LVLEQFFSSVFLIGRKLRRKQMDEKKGLFLHGRLRIIDRVRKHSTSSIWDNTERLILFYVFPPKSFLAKKKQARRLYTHLSTSNLQF